MFAPEDDVESRVLLKLEEVRYETANAHVTIRYRIINTASKAVFYATCRRNPGAYVLDQHLEGQWQTLLGSFCPHGSFPAPRIKARSARTFEARVPVSRTHPRIWLETGDRVEGTYRMRQWIYQDQNPKRLENGRLEQFELVSEPFELRPGVFQSG